MSSGAFMLFLSQLVSGVRNKRELQVEETSTCAGRCRRTLVELSEQCRKIRVGPLLWREVWLNGMLEMFELALKLEVKDGLIWELVDRGGAMG